jgi:hypothetical protein
MSDQPPLPGRPPAWNSEDEPTLAYPVPDSSQQQPYDGSQPPQPPQQQAPYQQPYGGQPPLPREQRYEGQPPRPQQQPYGGPQLPQHPQQPLSQPEPYGGQRPPNNPQQQVPWQQPPSGQQPSASYQQPQQAYQQPQQTYSQTQQGYQQPQAYYGQQERQYMAPGGYHGGQPPVKSRKSWLLAGAVALVVALVGGAGAVMLTRSGGDDEAGTPAPTGSYTDGLASTAPSSEPTETPSTSPSAEPTPTPSPTPTERRRTLKDVDKGIQVYDDVFVNPASGWSKYRQTKTALVLKSASRDALVFVGVDPVGYPAAKAAATGAEVLIDGDHLTGVRKAPVKTLRPANSNIDNQAELSYSAVYRKNGVSASLVGRCTAMTGVESIHNVTVVVCVEARKDSRDAAFRATSRMLASVARSI